MQQGRKAVYGLLYTTYIEKLFVQFDEPCPCVVYTQIMISNNANITVVYCMQTVAFCD